RRARFPLGDLYKGEVRELAREHGLCVADKPDSADICFVPGGDYRDVVTERTGGLGTPGALLDGAGQKVGSHAGVGAFTVGQRRGLGVALGTPAFVTDIDPSTGSVTVGPRAELARASCRVGGVSWLQRPAAPAPDVGWPDEDLLVQLRHHHEPETARLRFLAHEDGTDEVELRFDHPSLAVTPGQYAVFYRGDRVLGGGRILREDRGEDRA
ncbi:MAG: tRNA 2-thiouridine(34) synthase MnmA, partial [Planctomycetota bacterium]|nr:tRNA 2-thiouridine(34) synthase MnmA [Planctomycetota bacterium]